jgi:hypothetical protein
LKSECETSLRCHQQRLSISPNITGASSFHLGQKLTLTSGPLRQHAFNLIQLIC